MVNTGKMKTMLHINESYFPTKAETKSMKTKTHSRGTRDEETGGAAAAMFVSL